MKQNNVEILVKNVSLSSDLQRAEKTVSDQQIQLIAFQNQCLFLSNIIKDQEFRVNEINKKRDTLLTMYPS